MMLHIIFAIVAAVQLAVASPTYKIPLALSRVANKGQFCTYPEKFVIKNFYTWAPEVDSNHSAIIEFEYTDTTVIPNIETKCHFNDTSVNTGPKDLAARFACENNLVEFIWNEHELTVVESVCPLETMNRPFEAAGWITPVMECQPTNRNTTAGNDQPGQGCASTPDVLSAAFNSLEPRPN